ncbi:MAG: DUF2281 domain-containing protein [Candidatus Saccharibacteria bacterium]|nr:DUF2281 domain-containing protein [Rhodoferax sp.]
MVKINRMSMMSTTSERLLEAVQNLPEPLLVEVLDFADFLRARQTSTASQQKSALQVCAVGWRTPKPLENRLWLPSRNCAMSGVSTCLIPISFWGC